METVKQQLEQILLNESVYPVFQPIVSLRNGNLLGYEALSRIDGETAFSNTEEMFQAAEQHGEIWRLEQLCRKKVFKSIYRQKDAFDKNHKKLFVNVNPKVLHDDKFRTGFTREYLKRYGIDADKIVFEITERETIEDTRSFEQVISHYKMQDYGIAIDDMGSGYSGLNLICSLKPHYLKIDINLIRNIHKDTIKYAIVKGLAECSLSSGIQLIAEGIELEEELNTLIELGIQYGQGYLLAKPETQITEAAEARCKEIIRRFRDSHMKNYLGKTKYYVKNIAGSSFCVEPHVKVEKVLSYMEKNPEATGICVVDENKVQGIVTREKLLRQVSGRYGFSLHQNKSISELSDHSFLQVDAASSISSVAKIAMERETDSLYDFIVVNEEEKYFGIVTVQNLLKKAMEIDVDMAKSANPLTGLPGNVMIEQEMKRCVEEQEHYTVYYADLDNFKAFNDLYGFDKGDVVIGMLSDVLQKYAGNNGFVGHIGGDDFVMILYDYSEPEEIQKIRLTFEKEAHKLYTEEDRRKKHIISTNRQGQIECFPLLSVTIVSVSNQYETFLSHEEIVNVLTKYKKEAKGKKKFAS